MVAAEEWFRTSIDTARKKPLGSAATAAYAAYAGEDGDEDNEIAKCEDGELMI